MHMFAALPRMQTGAGKKAKNVVQNRQIESAREIVPQKYAGDATYENQIDTEKDRYARALSLFMTQAARRS